MTSSMEDQSLDLTTCCICLESYDLKEHKPKYLPCTHTFCQGCSKVSTFTFHLKNSYNQSLSIFPFYRELIVMQVNAIIYSQVNLLFLLILNATLFYSPGVGAWRVRPWSNWPVWMVDTRLTVYWKKLKKVKLNWMKCWMAKRKLMRWEAEWMESFRPSGRPLKHK